MYASEYVSVKIPRSALTLLHRLKAKLMLAREKKVADSEVIAEALRVMVAHEEEILKPKKVDLSDYVGFIKASGKKFDAAAEIDKVVYGV